MCIRDRLYATGNRTVRGLEAVTLCLPPCPGQSIIKRPDNADMHATGSMLGKMGYDVFYFYGGNSYFDNMEMCIRDSFRTETASPAVPII